MKRNLFLAAALVFILWSCDHITYTGYVYGTVTAESGDSTVTRVLITCAGKTYTTSSNGAYTIKDIPVGNQQLTATKTGYQTYSTTVKIETGANLQDISLVMNPAR